MRIFNKNIKSPLDNIVLKRQNYLVNFNKMKINKRGSHVGIALSFVVFVTFLIFLYSILEPTIKTQGDKQSLLDYLEKDLIENFSANLTTSTLSIIEKAPQNCVEIENLIEEIGINSRIIVKDESEDISQAYISKKDSNNLLINRDDSENTFFKIYSSEEFEELETSEINPCKTLKKDDGYSLGLTRKDKYIFEKRVIGLIERYNEEYESLKEELKIPLGSEFGFSFAYSNGTITGTEEKEISANIYADEIPMQYIDEDANILSGFINIRVW